MSLLESVYQSKIKLIPNVGNTILYEKLMDNLFGNKIKISNLELLHKGILIDYNDNLYFKINKLDEYLDLIGKRINFDLNYCPINYYNLVNVNDIPDIYNNLFEVLEEFRFYLENLDTPEAKRILEFYWKNVFKGVVSDYNENPFMLTLKFEGKNLKLKSIPLFLNITDKKVDMLNLLSFDLDDNKNQFESLYRYWNDILLMSCEEDYVVHCLTNVTGSEDIANFIFKSHSDKLKHIIQLDDLNEIINFKTNKKKLEYIELFKKLYEDKNIYKLIDDKIFINFEGFNKYLLNLETTYLHNFNEKEKVNTLYYNITNELINSYKQLYKFNS